MVSLGNDRRSPGGGYFFNSEASQAFDETDEASLISSVLIADEEPQFKTIPITGVIVVELFIVVGMPVFAFVIPNLVSSGPSFILNCLHIGIWCALFIGSSFMHYQHSLIQRFGYLEFSRKTQMLQKMPLLVVSFGNMLLLLLSILFQKFCPKSDICPLKSNMHCLYYLQIVLTSECMIIFPCLMKYLKMVIEFNQSKNEPDVHQDELLVSYMQSHAPTNEIGFRDEDYMEGILEKQADMIRYLKQHNIHLSRKILKLTIQMNSVQVSNVRF